MPSWASKGKARAEVELQDEGTGSADGIVIQLGVTSSSAFDIAYTVTGLFGAAQQNMSLQIDTGSSDLWVASKSCTSSLCNQLDGHGYDPSSSTSTGHNFEITYLDGQVKGPIVWDSVQIGGYSIGNQAFAAAEDISNEPLSSQFHGVLGLALPMNSVIAGIIPPVTDNSPDGAAWASNLFSITPTSKAPDKRFISLSLSRPGSSRIPAQLGIGRHPHDLVPDPSQVRYNNVIDDSSGVLFWKVSVRAITVYVDGVRKPVDIGGSNTGAILPNAILDSGVPLFLTTSTVANGIYGAIGVNPASDGNYYLPCITPLNISITIDGYPEIPLHPLDLTSEPPKDTQATSCIGLIQPSDKILSTSSSQVGDIILGVPFLRNVYSVMAYAAPSSNGSFPSMKEPVNGTNITMWSEWPEDSQSIIPRLGLMPLTDPTTALAEFKRVRVDRQPIDQAGKGGNRGGGSVKGLNVGIIALISILGFFVLSFMLFGLRWVCFRRRYSRASGIGGEDGGTSLPTGILHEEAGNRNSRNGDDLRTALTEEGVGYEAYMQFNTAPDNADSPSISPAPKMEIGSTRETQLLSGKDALCGGEADEFGYIRDKGETLRDWRNTDPMLIGEINFKEWEPEDLYKEFQWTSIEGCGWKAAPLARVPVALPKRRFSITMPLLEELDEEGTDEFDDRQNINDTNVGKRNDVPPVDA